MTAANIHSTLERLVNQSQGLDDLISEINRIVNRNFLKHEALNQEEYRALIEWEASRRFFEGLRKELQHE